MTQESDGGGATNLPERPTPPRASVRRTAYGPGMWEQLIRARHYAGLTQEELGRRIGVTQAQIARLEKHGYDHQSLSSLRRYVEGLGPGFALDVRIITPEDTAEARRDG